MDGSCSSRKITLTLPSPMSTWARGKKAISLLLFELQAEEAGGLVEDDPAEGAGGHIFDVGEEGGFGNEGAGHEVVHAEVAVEGELFVGGGVFHGDVDDEDGS